MDTLEGSSLIEVADLIIKGVKEGSHHALELFPKVLTAISSQKKIAYHKGKFEINSRIYELVFVMCKDGVVVCL